MKTIKQIANELGLPKQKVYRFIKSNNISEVHRVGSTCFYDAPAESAITLHFMKMVSHGEAHQTTSNHIKDDAIEDDNNATVNALITMLQKELEIKNQQIADLSAALTAAQQTAAAAQALHAGTMVHLTDGEAQPVDEKQPSLFSRIFGRKK